MLLVQKTTANKNLALAEVERIKCEIKAKVDTDVFKQMTEKITDSPSTFQKDLQAYKLKKYDRDT